MNMNEVVEYPDGPDDFYTIYGLKYRDEGLPSICLSRVYRLIVRACSRELIEFRSVRRMICTGISIVILTLSLGIYDKLI